MASLNLLVLRADKPNQIIPFCEALGVTFKAERHGKGPEHYSGMCGDALLEIYPSLSGETTTATRFGFTVDDVEQACLAVGPLGRVIREPSRTQWGIKAVLADPVGHNVEHVQRS